MNDAHGDIIDTQHAYFTRLYFKNISGFPHYDSHKLELKHLLVNASKKSIDIMCLVESNLNWRSHSAYSNCKNTIQNQFNSGPITFTSINTDIPWHNAYQPGGLLIAVMNPTDCRIESKTPDHKLGR